MQTLLSQKELLESNDSHIMLFGQFGSGVTTALELKTLQLSYTNKILFQSFLDVNLEHSKNTITKYCPIPSNIIFKSGEIYTPCNYIIYDNIDCVYNNIHQLIRYIDFQLKNKIKLIYTVGEPEIYEQLKKNYNMKVIYANLYDNPHLPPTYIDTLRENNMLYKINNN